MGETSASVVHCEGSVSAFAEAQSGLDYFHPEHEMTVGSSVVVVWVYKPVIPVFKLIQTWWNDVELQDRRTISVLGHCPHRHTQRRISR